jgi:hypothetical protein
VGLVASAMARRIKSLVLALSKGNSCGSETREAADQTTLRISGTALDGFARRRQSSRPKLGESIGSPPCWWCASVRGSRENELRHPVFVGFVDRRSQLSFRLPGAREAPGDVPRELTENGLASG